MIYVYGKVIRGQKVISLWPSSKLSTYNTYVSFFFNPETAKDPQSRSDLSGDISVDALIKKIKDDPSLCGQQLSCMK